MRNVLSWVWIETKYAPGAPSGSMILFSEGCLNTDNALNSYGPFWSPKHVLICVFHLIPVTTLRAGQRSHRRSLGPCSTGRSQGPISGHRGPESERRTLCTPSLLLLPHTAQPNPFLVLSKISLATQPRSKSRCFIHLGGQMPGSVDENMPLWDPECHFTTNDDPYCHLAIWPSTGSTE